MIGHINSSTISTLQSTNNNQKSGATERSEASKPLSRVDEIKKQIEAGEYKIDLAKTAEKLAEALS